MKLIKEIYQDESKVNNYNQDNYYKVKKATRAILFKNNNKIALLNVTKDNYHKLPGGGIKENENIIDGLKREIIEEVGAEIKILDEIGVIIEYRNLFSQIQISYCYLAQVEGNIHLPNYTEEEKEKGFELIWVDIDEAIDILNEDEPQNYVGKFIQKRDLTFLLEGRRKFE